MTSPKPCPVCADTPEIAETDPEGWNHGQYDCEVCREVSH